MLKAAFVKRDMRFITGHLSYGSILSKSLVGAINSKNKYLVGAINSKNKHLVGANNAQKYLTVGAIYGIMSSPSIEGGFYMERTAMQKLIDWNNKSKRKPLIVWGARQVGKTYLVKDMFAEQYYSNKYIYVDFKKEDDINAFCLQNTDPEKIIEFISLSKGKKVDASTLLIFDEIQECPNIISALKYFCQDFRDIPVIATGSMVRIKLTRESKKRGNGHNKKFLFPVGKINQITIYPMTFDEFLMNANRVLYDKIKASFEANTVPEPQIHDLAMDYVYKYLLVGGMPEAVESYIDNEDLFDSREVLVELYDNYLADMELYQASQESILRSRALFRNIYKELNKECKNFSPGLIEAKSKTRDFQTSVEWLTLAHVVNQSFQLKEHVTMPLIADEDTSFRLFLGDIGMFAYQSGINASSFVSTQRENTLSGIFFENFIACELAAKGIDLFYWRGKSSSELEFIVESDNKLYPIDVKKGRGTLNSLEKFANHNAFEYAIKVSKNNYGYNAEQKLLTVPFYYFPFLAIQLKNGTMKKFI